MSVLKELLASTDDDYLIGLSNKGIMKRAHKDLEGISPVVTWEGEVASVNLGEETCRICVPLGESSCSCPSRSICRHVVSAILWLKEQNEEGNVEEGKGAEVEEAEEGKSIEAEEKVKLGEKTEAEGEARKEKSVEAGGEVEEGKSIEAEEKVKLGEKTEAGEKARKEKSVEAGEEIKNGKIIEAKVGKGVEEAKKGKGVGAEETKKEKSVEAGEKVKVGENTEAVDKAKVGKGNKKDDGSKAEDIAKAKKTETTTLPPKKELLDVSLKKLRTACGAKRYRLFYQKLKTKEKPELQETSTVTVTFPEEGIKVKLLEPLSYSTCSCHSKELCAHKGEAILWYQIEKGKLTPEELEKELEEDKTWDKNRIKEIAASIKEVLKEQFLTGLSRMSPTAEDTMERMAIICHEGNLPEFENRFRQLNGEYQLYFTRNASFETGRLRKKLLELYNMADKLERAGTIEQISKLAGQFRDTYEPIGELNLMGIGQRHFKSKSGYEGETYYFLELDTTNLYTWTDARPTFYEGRRRPPQSGAQMEAPWGLMCTREQMAQMTFRLSSAKATKDGRLSVSKETKGELIGEGNFNHPILDDMIACNYEELLKEQFLKGMKEEKDQLVFVKAEQVGEAEFDSVNQVFHMELFDKEENKIYVTVHYTPEEKLLIWALEKMQERIKKNSDKKKVFFGRLYLEDGKCHLYPIECFERGE